MKYDEKCDEWGIPFTEVRKMSMYLCKTEDEADDEGMEESDIVEGREEVVLIDRATGQEVDEDVLWYKKVNYLIEKIFPVEAGSGIDVHE